MNTWKISTAHGSWRKAGAAAVLTLLAATGASAKPIIMSPEPVFDFGQVENDQKVSHEFTIKNAGDEPLAISDVKTSCGCTVAELATRSLEPGQETKVSAIFDLKGKQGAQNKRITVVSNDPDQPAFFLEMKGTALTTILVEPAILNMGKIEDDAPHRQSVVFRSMREGHSFQITEVTASENAAFTTELETVTPGKEYKVTAITNANPMPGALSGRITVKTDDKSRPVINLNVYGNVLGPLNVRPDVINIQANSAPDARPASMYLQVLPGRVKEFELLEVIAPIEGMKAELIQRKLNDFHIRLSDMPVDQSLKDKELILRTNLPDLPELRIPFRVRPELPTRAGRAPARIPGALAPNPNAPRPVIPTPPQKPEKAETP